MNTGLDSLGSVGWAVAAVAMLLLAAHGCGRLVTVSGVRGASQPLARETLRIAVGLNLLSVVGMTLGMLRLLGGGWSAWLLAALALLSIILIGRDRQKDAWRGTRLPPRGIALAWLSLVVVTLGPALSFPSGWDELVYHHELPRRWLTDGWPAFYSDLPYSGFPSLGEVLFWLMAPIEDVIAPRLLGWACWMLGLFFLYYVLRRQLAACSASVLTGAFAVSSTLLMISANCYVETIQMMNFAGLLFVMRQRRATAKETWRKAAIIGVLAGGAAAIKLTGAAILVVPWIWYLLEARRDKCRIADSARLVALYSAIAVAVALPFYLRPWLLTGDPFYPYYAPWFSDEPARLEMSRYHHALGSAFGVRGPAAFFFAPVLLAFDRDIFDGDFGWQILIFIVLAALAIAGSRGKRTRLILFPTAASLGLYAFWFFTAQQARFAIPAAISILVLAAMELQRLHGVRRKWVLAALIVAAAISMPWRTGGHYLGSWLSVLRLVRAEAYVNVATEREYLPLIRAIEERTPRDAKLMLLFEHRGFYLPRRFKIGTPFFQEAVFTPPEPFSDSGQVMSVLRREQITHLVMTDRPRGPDVAAAWRERLDPFLAGIQHCLDEGQLRPIWESERYVLLEVAGSTEREPAGSP